MFLKDHQDADLMEIDSVSDADYSQLMPLLWLEVSAIFDGHSIEFQNKPYKRKHKESKYYFFVFCLYPEKYYTDLNAVFTVT